MQKTSARNIIVGFSRIGGQVVGVVANQPYHLAGCLDINAADKASGLSVFAIVLTFLF